MSSWTFVGTNTEWIVSTLQHRSAVQRHVKEQILDFAYLSTRRPCQLLHIFPVLQQQCSQDCFQSYSSFCGYRRLVHFVSTKGARGCTELAGELAVELAGVGRFLVCFVSYRRRQGLPRTCRSGSSSTILCLVQKEAEWRTEFAGAGCRLLYFVSYK